MFFVRLELPCRWQKPALVLLRWVWNSRDKIQKGLGHPQTRWDYLEINGCTNLLNMFRTQATRLEPLWFMETENSHECFEAFWRVLHKPAIQHQWQPSEMPTLHWIHFLGLPQLLCPWRNSLSSFRWGSAETLMNILYLFAGLPLTIFWLILTRRTVTDKARLRPKMDGYCPKTAPISKSFTAVHADTIY